MRVIVDKIFKEVQAVICCFFFHHHHDDQLITIHRHMYASLKFICTFLLFLLLSQQLCWSISCALSLLYLLRNFVSTFKFRIWYMVLNYVITPWSNTNALVPLFKNGSTYQSNVFGFRTEIYDLDFSYQPRNDFPEFVILDILFFYFHV